MIHYFRGLATQWWQCRPELQLGHRFFFLSVVLISIFTFSCLSSSVSLSYFNVTAPVRKCSGEHSLTSYTFPEAILNATAFFCYEKTIKIGNNAVELILLADCGSLPINPYFNGRFFASLPSDALSHISLLSANFRLTKLRLRIISSRIWY